MALEGRASILSHLIDDEMVLLISYLIGKRIDSDLGRFAQVFMFLIEVFFLISSCGLYPRGRTELDGCWMYNAWVLQHGLWDRLLRIYAWKYEVSDVPHMQYTSISDVP
jgi:hypothetical protein